MGKEFIIVEVPCHHPYPIYIPCFYTYDDFMWMQSNSSLSSPLCGSFENEAISSAAGPSTTHCGSFENDAKAGAAGLHRLRQNLRQEVEEVLPGNTSSTS